MLAYAGGAACELAWRVARRRDDPPMTRFLALQLSASHSYSIAALERDLGYRERVTTAEATERLVELLRASEPGAAPGGARGDRAPADPSRADESAASGTLVRPLSPGDGATRTPPRPGTAP